MGQGIKDETITESNHNERAVPVTVAYGDGIGPEIMEDTDDNSRFREQGGRAGLHIRP